MGWVVKQWRTEGLEALLADEALAAVRAARATADRDARRAHRIAGRTSASAAAELERLERLAVELKASVRGQRAAVRSGAPVDGAGVARAVAGPRVVADAAAVAGPPVVADAAAVADPPAAPATPAAAPRRRRPARASLRGSPLAELFRATAPS